ncbi:MAG: RnfABCDGE type electron transport complex subunit G [Paludibacteraceae bacterium]|nr:RnfABCDGE type electron transport complex subunit G [Paludibacteraceae bacterium]
MKRLESNLTNMLIVLTVVTLAAAALLGGLYVLTEKPIADQKKDKQEKAIKSVLPSIEGMEIAAPDTVKGMVLYKAYRDGEWIATAVETVENGFGGKFKVMIGFDKQGNVVNYEVLEHQETPGLGDKMVTWFKNEQKPGQNILGSNPAERKFVVSKDGGEVDAITAATISSRAFLKAVNSAYNAINEGAVEVSTGASQIVKEETVADETLAKDSVAVEATPQENASEVQPTDVK